MQLTACYGWGICTLVCLSCCACTVLPLQPCTCCLSCTGRTHLMLKRLNWRSKVERLKSTVLLVDCAYYAFGEFPLHTPRALSAPRAHMGWVHTFCASRLISPHALRHILGRVPALLGSCQTAGTLCYYDCSHVALWLLHVLVVTCNSLHLTKQHLLVCGVIS